MYISLFLLWWFSCFSHVIPLGFYIYCVGCFSH
nr:MAG TPA: hypothetical protein [Caudoviricetes sp.]